MAIHIAEGHCFHCGLPNLEAERYSVVIKQHSYSMCCPGCHAVASSIVENGLESYYEFRTEPAARGDSALDNTMAKLAVYDEPELQEEFVFDSGAHKEIQLTVEGITCAACGWLIEKQLAKVAGIKQVSVNVGARRASIIWDNSEIKLSQVLQKLKSIGYESLPFQADNHEASYHKEQKSFLKKVGLSGIMTMQVMMLAMGQYFDLFGNIDAETTRYFNWISLVLTTPVVLYSGSVFYLSALKALVAKTVNMDIPVTIAILATYVAGFFTVNNEKAEVYFESICMFVFFLLISRFLEHRSRHKATQISSNMLKHIPVTANRVEGDALVSVLAKQLRVDDIVLVKTGETIPVDGLITDGNGRIDEAMLTGEFEPVYKTQGQHVFGGTINQHGVITVKVTNTLKHAMVNQILRLQQTALSNKPRVAQVADRLSRYFVVAVLSISALTYSFWTLQGNPHAFWITISVLVATCPCALGLATPSALTCSMAKLNNQGILLKRADALEQLTEVSDIIFDKTGTLTHGEFSIQKTWYSEQLTKNRCEELLSIASSIEKRSEHPIANAFKDITPCAKTIESVDIRIGMGISTRIDDNVYHLGSASFVLTELSENLPELTPDAINGANVLLSENGKLVAAFWITDEIKQEAAEVLSKLDQFTLGILSGDTTVNVANIAKQLGIEVQNAEQSPNDKLAHIQRLQANGRKILMLGDGINDAPVLAASDVSIAVGNASDLAKNAADVILLKPQIDGVVDLLDMALRTKKKIKQNIAWALGYNILVLPFAMIGLLTPWMAALGMSLSSIIVVYNSTRLMRSKNLKISVNAYMPQGIGES
ncbi:heavy metal translocating P-type ATPase [Glaciecola sp. MH2013]|uniref:heavy metal translocating P-type ATPase n=1 Tax=Glaciecola sp. MH2013 TaxID=2785524 RepID=UPI00189F64AF|nr:heavy metal translocating P-type ATPase [Glaciecola sp. MH2013]MBF7072830.1 heavy metal translocating P-type ATPase [Glaciecola sp. MH2013]